MNHDTEAYAQMLIQVIDICNNPNLTPGQRIYEVRRVLMGEKS